VHIDAHPDLYDDFEGDRYSHACPFARIMEEGLADRLIQIGIRTMTGHQRAQARRFGVEVVEMRHLKPDIRIPTDVPLYVSIDIDALDPAFAPGVSHREPGGMSVRQLLSVIQSLEAPIVAAEVVELNQINERDVVVRRREDSARAAGRHDRPAVGLTRGWMPFAAALQPLAGMSCPGPVRRAIIPPMHGSSQHTPSVAVPHGRMFPIGRLPAACTRTIL
jgi:hypothetical protein